MNHCTHAIEGEVFLGQSLAEWCNDAQPTTPILKAALAFWKHGFNVIPLNDDKTPLVKWKQWQKTRQHWKDVIALYLEREHPPALGVLTGTFGRLIVLDIDGPKGEETLQTEGLHLPHTPEVRTPRGRHLWFTVPCDWLPQSRIFAEVYGFDLISKGRYIVAPPSRINGFEYNWVVSPQTVPIANLPEEVVQLAERLSRSHLRRLEAGGDDATAEERKHPTGDASIEPPSITLSLDTCYPDTCNLDTCKLDTGFSLNGQKYTKYTADPGSYTRIQKGDLERLYSDPAVIAAVATVLGIPGDAIPRDSVGGGAAFCCVIPGHEEERPSASLARNAKGVIIYNDWHERDSDKVYTLPAVYFARVTGRVPRAFNIEAAEDDQERHFRGPEHAVWALRLLIEADVLKPLHIDLPELPPDARPSLQAVYEGFRALFACKWTYEPGAPTTFSWRFAASWCGVAPKTAAEAVKTFLKLKIVRIVGKVQSRFGRTMALFGPGPGTDERVD